MKPQPSRTPSKLSESLHHQLNMYALAASAAGVGMLALAQRAEAKIVYTSAHQKLPINKDFFLDLNQDGVNDFGFHIASGNGRSESWQTLRVGGKVTGNQVVGKKAPHPGRFSYFASALQGGVFVGTGGGLKSYPGGEMAAHSFIAKGGTSNFYGYWTNSGKGVNRRYLGLKFLIKGQVHYGWARFNVWMYGGPYSHAHAVLTGYAYETIPNKGIITGKTKGPDVVTARGSLGRLALGRK